MKWRGTLFSLSWHLLRCRAVSSWSIFVLPSHRPVRVPQSSFRTKNIHKQAYIHLLHSLAINAVLGWGWVGFPLLSRKYEPYLNEKVLLLLTWALSFILKFDIDENNSFLLCRLMTSSTAERFRQNKVSYRNLTYSCKLLHNSYEEYQYHKIVCYCHQEDEEIATFELPFTKLDTLHKL